MNMTHRMRDDGPVIVAAVDCPEIWDLKINKIHITKDIILSCHTIATGERKTSSFTSVVCTGYDLHRIVARSVYENALACIESDIDKTKVEIYDDDSSKFLSLTDNDVMKNCDIVLRFGKRVRCTVSNVRIGAFKEATDGLDKHTGVNPLAIMGRFYTYNPNGIQFAEKKLVVKEIPNNCAGVTGLNVWDGALLL